MSSRNLFYINSKKVWSEINWTLLPAGLLDLLRDKAPLDFLQKGQKLAIAAACEKSQSFPPIFFLYLLIV